jgi:hypothetical protein
MTERSDHHLLVVEKRVAGQLQVFRWVDHDVEIVPIVAHARHDALALGDFEVDEQLWIASGEVAQQAWQKVLGGGHQRDPQTATLQTFQIGNGRFEAAPDVVEGPCCLQQLLPRRGQDDLAA